MKRLPNVNDVLAHVNSVHQEMTTQEKTAEATPVYATELAQGLAKLANDLRKNNSVVSMGDVVTFHQRLMRNA